MPGDSYRLSEDSPCLNDESNTERLEEAVHSSFTPVLLTASRLSRFWATMTEQFATVISLDGVNCSFTTEPV
jgi:hypothetical protein